MVVEHQEGTRWWVDFKRVQGGGLTSRGYKVVVEHQEGTRWWLNIKRVQGGGLTSRGYKVVG